MPNRVWGSYRATDGAQVLTDRRSRLLRRGRARARPAPPPDPYPAGFLNSPTTRSSKDCCLEIVVDPREPKPDLQSVCARRLELLSHEQTLLGKRSCSPHAVAADETRLPHRRPPPRRSGHYSERSRRTAAHPTGRSGTPACRRREGSRSPRRQSWPSPEHHRNQHPHDTFRGVRGLGSFRVARVPRTSGPRRSAFLG